MNRINETELKVGAVVMFLATAILKVDQFAAATLAIWWSTSRA